MRSFDWMLDKNKELNDYYSAEDKKHTSLKVKKLIEEIQLNIIWITWFHYI